MRHLYGQTIEQEGSVHFDAVVVSHPDSDHFNGLTRVLRDRKFTFGTIYHNGILRYYENTPEGSEFDLGNITTDAQGQSYLTDTVSTLSQVEDRINTGSLMSQFKDFWMAALQAKQQERLRSARRLTSRDDFVPGFEPRSGQLRLVAKVLGPVPTKPSGAIRYVTFTDPHDHPSKMPSSSHTRNGHSVILRLEFGAHSFLFGGDLNIPAQQHLLNYYGRNHPFEADVAKACHHGSSDFDVSYIKKVNPHVNVFSSGDNKSFDHPMADALGAIGKHTRGDYPLLFSTEIARANSSAGIHYGLVNARSNGTVLTMAQMKEQHNRTDIWDSYTVPWSGRFSGH
jgi:beta-lactamase superfamily II metal-dependent hydrolase